MRNSTLKRVTKDTKSFTNYYTLSEEHQEMFRDNIRLIHWYINSKNLDTEASYSTLSECLADSIVRYDENKGSLSNYFYKNAHYAMTKVYRKRVNEIPNDFTSVSFKLEINSNIQEDEAYQKLHTNVIECLEGRDKELFVLLDGGYTRREICEHFCVSRVTLLSWIKKLKEKVEDIIR